MRIFRGILIIVGVTATLAGCTKADTKPDGVNGPMRDDVNNATFQIKSFVKGKAYEVTAEDIFVDPKDGAKRASKWRIPREAVFTFGACMRDAATKADAEGHRFDVQLPRSSGKVRIDKSSITPTQPDGCFTWMETIPFSYFVKRGRWVVVERDIVGTGIHSGRQRIKIALNPWAISGRDGGDPVVYIREGRGIPEEQLINAAKEDFSDESLGQDQLWVDDVSIQTIRRGESNTGTLLTMNVTMEPKVRFENSAGVPAFKKIVTGDFIVKGHLVMSGAGDKLKDKMILTTGVAEDETGKIKASSDDVEISGTGEVIDGKLVARIKAFVDPRVKQGNLDLVLKVIPTVRGLKAFGGVYELGAFRNLAGSMSGTLSESCRNEKGCDSGAYLRSAKNYDEVRAKALASSGSPYLFDRLKLRFVQVQPGETATRRTVAYSASTCVVDAYTGDRVVGLSFDIHYQGLPVIKKDTAEDGCLNWDSNIFHQYYKPEEFIEQSVTISKGTGVSRELKFYINPWDDKFTFGFDEREFTEQFWSKLKERKKIPSRFFMSDYGYHTVRFQYNIDDLMGLEVRKTVLMELQPQVLRYSGIINARKMTEPLRDGIWLMKVGIQKSYLDPATAGVVIDQLQNNQAMVRMNSEPGGAARLRTLNRLRKLGIEAPTKEYISTETALVRVTDGVVIQPVELRMQDLRMMRIRKNFLTQWESVDERKLQADNALHRGLQQEIEELLETRRKSNEVRRQNNKEITVEEKAEIEKEENEIRERVEGRRKVSKRVFDYINRQLDARGSFDAGTVSWDELRLEDNQKEYIRKLLGYDTKPDRESLKAKLETNDFTDLRLPACSDGNKNCADYLEQNSGLERRTFVGPVIFLSNAYKDSVRATDNLDEAKCGRKVEFDDPLEAELSGKEHDMFMDSDAGLEKDRQNSLYKFSEYFGSLRHLCFSHVDDLIKREREDRELYQKSGAAVASVYQFVKGNNLEFLSLGNEQPKTVDLVPEAVERCNRNLVECMTPTNDRWIKAEDGVALVNRMVKNVSINSWGPVRWVSKNLDDVKLEPWDVEDLRAALFDDKSPRAQRYAACALTVTHLMDQIKTSGTRMPTETVWTYMIPNFIERCMGSDQYLSADKKLRVFRTGRDEDPYIFLGGLQLNLNVGQSFSVSRSDSWSWSYGFEPGDMLAWLGGAGRVAATVAKPFSLKVGKSHSFSNSDGTSVADSTYLVAQIARFQVRLDEYEQCMVLRLTPEFLQDNIFQFGKPALKALEKGYGLFVCEGQHKTEPRYVKEDYFYFTQHFTEGDMLDQADLYNHPWLLALRGQRDFGTFLHMVRAQEVLSFSNFVEGALPGGKLRNIGWPLEQMLNVYKSITPSFPGLYTVLDQNEEMTKFPLERRMSKVDADINFEMISRERRFPRNSASSQ